MCIIFLRFAGNSQGAVSQNGYKLILGSNRDEYFVRKALPAGFWEENPHVLAGKDMTPGKEGGTWLGINKAGNVGVLTNHLEKADFETRNEKLELRSRGPIVFNYLKEKLDPISYSNMLKKEQYNYDSFNAIFGGFTKNGYECVYINNANGEQPQSLEPGTHGLSNGLINNTWTKVVVGKERFSEIVEKNLNKEELISNIMNLLGDDTRHFPDDGGLNIDVPEELVEGFSSICVKLPEFYCGTRHFPDNGGLNIDVPEELVEGFSSICVKLPEFYCGTRTHTVILIDENNHATFVERTMSDPMNIDDPGWVTNKFEFQIENPEL